MDKDVIKLTVLFMSIYPLGGGIACIIMWLFFLGHNVTTNVLLMGFGFVGCAILLNLITITDNIVE